MPSVTDAPRALSIGHAIAPKSPWRIQMVRNRTAPRPYARLTTPLVRDDGVLRPAPWEEALDRAAAGFTRNLKAGGPDALGTFSCSKSTNEMNFLAGKLSRVAFGTNNIDSCNRT